jgi:seryl-tRNA synthetase
MHDIKIIRDDAGAFAAGLKRRGIRSASTVVADIVALDKELREIQSRLQQAQARRNDVSKQIGAAKAKKDESLAQSLMSEVEGLKGAIQADEGKEREQQRALNEILSALPNIPAADVPDGTDENDNVEVSSRAFGRAPGMNASRDHVDLGEALGLLDFAKAAEVSGSRFVYVKGALARLERALASFMLDIHTQQFGYEEVVPPLLVRDGAMFGTGQLPKFEDDLFKTTKQAETESTTDRLWLVPTAEVPLTNYVRESILDEGALPLRFTAFTPCFRAEAGAAGKDTRGMIRMHQFSKVELVSITTPEMSSDEHERMTSCAQEILKQLGLHHRVMTLCTGDIGFSAMKTYDIEVWLPGQNRFREISSCSNCGDFQARRMNARFRSKNAKQSRFVHTLNGSGLAIGRTIVAIMENYQDGAGSIAVPEALRPYMGGLERITK